MHLLIFIRRSLALSKKTKFKYKRTLKPIGLFTDVLKKN